MAGNRTQFERDLQDFHGIDVRVEVSPIKRPAPSIGTGLAALASLPIIAIVGVALLVVGAFGISVMCFAGGAMFHDIFG